MNIKDSIENSIDLTVSFLQKIVKIDTQQEESIKDCPFGEGPKKALDEVLKYCENLGFKVKNIDNYIGFAEIGEGEELIGIPMHLDVVPPGNGWSVEPFAGKIIDGVIYGRGVVDNKGSISMLIHVVNNIKNCCPYINKRIRLIFGTNEETGMECIRYYLNKKEEIPSEGFTPDAMYPIINGEKGRLHIQVRKTINVDNNKCYINVDGGIKENVVPSECEAKIFNIDVNKKRNLLRSLEKDNSKVKSQTNSNYVLLNTNGTSAHGSTPEKGENAIDKMLSIIVQQNIDMQNKKEIEKIYKYLGVDYNGKALEIYREDEIFKNTTVNLGVLKINNSEILVELDIRYGLKIDEIEIVNLLKDKFNDGWEVNVVARKKLHYVDEKNEVVKKLLDAYEEVTGKQGYCLTMGGGTYASYFDNMVAFGPKFIDCKTGGHGVDERISIEHLKINMEIYTKALLNLLKK